MKGEHLWKWAALALAVMATVVTLNTWLSARRHSDLLNRKRADVAHIQAYVHRWAAEDALRADWENKQIFQPADLTEMASQALGSGVAKISLRSPVPAVGGWQRREAAVELPSVDFAEAATFLTAAAHPPPPWRLIEIEVRPANEAGKGTLNLVLETLEKKRP